MTARAFLGLSDELREAFAKAQDDETLRYLHIKIVNEDTLTTVGSKQKSGDLETDFDSLGQVRLHSAIYISSQQLRRSVRVPPKYGLQIILSVVLTSKYVPSETESIRKGKQQFYSSR